MHSHLTTCHFLKTEKVRLKDFLLILLKKKTKG